MIEFQRLHKSYAVAGREVSALQPLDLTIEAGEVFGIIGHSGAGKSTLIRMINRLEEPSGGRLLIGGEDVTALDADGLRTLRRRIGMIFQHFNLLSSRTVAGNVEIGLGDGTVYTLGPGDMMLAEDLTGQGHTTKAVGTETRVSVALTLD